MLRPIRNARFLVSAALVAAVAAGCAACASAEPAERSERSELDEVIDRLQEDFIDRDAVSDAELERAAVRGVIEYVDDPYTSYLPPERYEAFTRALAGQGEEFEGIGASVTERNGQIIILGPLPGSPALRAGLRAGDVVLAVDGASIQGFTLEETVTRIRGPKDSEVVLTISRAGLSRPFDLVIRRDTIRVSSLTARLQGERIGYVQIASFDATTGERFREAIAGLRESGAEGLIVDLRNNSGGLVAAAVAVVSEFVPEGEVIRWVDADGERTVERVTGGGSAYDLPLVVVVNAYSASASEVVAGALQDHGRAIVVGTRTFGKGSVNLLHGLESGAGLYVTTARWLTPDGRRIEGDGIEPDVPVGAALNAQGLARIGELARELCGAYADEAGGLGGQERLVEALDGLCNIEPADPTPPAGDEQLDAAIVELLNVIGG